MGQGKWLENEFSKMCFSSDSLSFGPINPQPKMSFMSAWVIAIYWISKVLTKVENPKPLCLCIYVLGFGFSKIFPGLDFGFQFLKWWFEFWCGVAENTFLDFVIVCSLLLGWLWFLKFIYWAWKCGFQFLMCFEIWVWTFDLVFWIFMFCGFWFWNCFCFANLFLGLDFVDFTFWNCFLKFGLGIWKLFLWFCDFVLCSLFWPLGFALFVLGLRTQISICVFNLNLGVWGLSLGFWILNLCVFWFWKALVLQICCLGLENLDFNFWNWFNFLVWVCDLGFWIL